MKGRRSRSADIIGSFVHLDGDPDEEDMFPLAFDGSETRAIDGQAIRSPSPLLIDTSFSPLAAMRPSSTHVSVVDEGLSDSPLLATRKQLCYSLSCKHALMVALGVVLLTVPLSLLTSVVLMREQSSKTRQQIVYTEDEQLRSPFFWELDKWVMKSRSELDQEIMTLEIRKQLMEELARNSPPMDEQAY